MTVFKGYMTIAKKCFSSIILYFAITMGITLGIQMSGQNTTEQMFEAERLRVGIVDADEGSLARGLREYIGQVHDVEMLADDEGMIQEQLVYQNVHYVVYIPENFEESSLREKQQLNMTSIPNVYGAFYVEQRIDAFLNGVMVYEAAGYSLEDSIALILETGTKEVDVQVLDVNGNGGRRAGYTYMLEYIPYAFLTSIASLGVVIGVFNNKEIRRKMLSSPFSLKKQNLEQIMAFGVMGILFVFTTLLVMTGIYKMEFWQSDNVWYYLGNLMSFLVVSLALAFAIGITMKKEETISHMVTVTSLVFCFLGGIFVPLEFLGDGVKRVSQFLPTYWYATNVHTLMERSSLPPELRADIFKGYGMQLIFALACMAVALAVVKYQSQER